MCKIRHFIHKIHAEIHDFKTFVHRFHHIFHHKKFLKKRKKSKKKARKRRADGLKPSPVWFSSSAEPQNQTGDGSLFATPFAGGCSSPISLPKQVLIRYVQYGYTPRHLRFRAE